MNTPPKTLWLQWHGDAEPDDTGDVAQDQVTWNYEKVFNDDIEYVHADVIRRELLGHSKSLLFGDAGLLAATKRCLHLLEHIENLVQEYEQTIDVGATVTVAKIRRALNPPKLSQD
jgi:hypothetical protein